MKTFIYFLIFSAILLLAAFINFRFGYKPIPNTYVSLSPAITETIYQLGGEDRLVGVTTNCDTPKEATKKPKIGGAFFLNKEAILQLRPEHLFAFDFQKPQISELEAAGINIHYYKYETMEEALANIRDIGYTIGKKEKTDHLIATLTEEIATYKTSNPKRVFFAIQSEPLYTVGKRSFINDLILHSGHINVTGKIDFDYPKISVEELLIQKPDIIFTYTETSKKYLQRYFDTNYIILTYEQGSTLSRPSYRMVESLKFFSSL